MIKINFPLTFIEKIANNLLTKPGDKASMEITKTGRKVSKYESGDDTLKFGQIEYPNSDKVMKWFVEKK